MSIQAVDLAYLKSLFPELENTPSAVVDALSEAMAPIYVDEAVFGKSSRYALALVIAHQVKLDEMRGGGSKTSESVGGVSVSQAALGQGSSSTNWDTTSYGRRFVELCRMFVVPMTFVAPAGGLPPQPFSFVASTFRTPQA